MSLSSLLPILESNNNQLTELLTGLDQLENIELVKKLKIMLGKSPIAQLRDLQRDLKAQIDTAKRPFTLAVVGEFKAGKSTLLNALLGLQGELGLPTGVPPATAKSIIISYREDGLPSANIKWLDGSEEITEWSRARNLIDHLWLEQHPEDMKISERISDVTYYLKNPILSRLNLNDLPGPGAKNLKDTELAYEKMKQADAIIWLIGDVPNNTDVSFLNALSESSQKVTPVINIREDLPNHIYRDENEVNAIKEMVIREFQQYFSSDFKEPLMVSAKMIEHERAKDNPDESLYDDYGLTEMLKVIQGFQEQSIDPDQSQRIKRIKGVSVNLLTRSISNSGILAQELKTEINKLESSRSSHDDKIFEISQITDRLRAEIRTLARSRAGELCRIVSGHGKVFVGDTLQLSNFNDLITTLTKGRNELEKKLQDRFINEYLLLNHDPNWLTSLCNQYAEDVRAVLIPEWRSFWSKLSCDELGRIEMEHPGITFNSLSDSLVKAMIDVIMRIVTVLGVAGLLVEIPGGVIIDAVGVVGVIIISMIRDPLEGSRKRAIKRVELQVDSQSYEIQDNLLKAGMDANSLIANEIRDIVKIDINITTQGITALTDFNHKVSMYFENTKEHLNTLSSS